MPEDQNSIADDRDSEPTAAERAEERAMYVREDRLRLAVSLTVAAMEHGGLREHGAAEFLGHIHEKLTAIDAPPPASEEPAPEAAAVEPPKPAVPIKKSVTDDYLVSLIDGSKLQTLRRHLTKHGHTPDSYRAAYGLPGDYPLVCKAYGEKRRALAKEMGLGKRQAAAAAPQAA